MLLTPLSKWVDVPEGYRGLMMDQKKKGGLRQQLADIKVGPLRHAAGNHADGELVHATVQVGLVKSLCEAHFSVDCAIAWLL
jgi:hypothetical protein